MKEFKSSRLKAWYFFIWQTKKVELGYLILVTTIILLIVFAGLLYNSDYAPRVQIQHQESIFFTGLFIFSAIAIYAILRNWISKGEGIYKNILPFSTTDHFIGLLTTLVFVIPFCFCIVYYFVDVPALWISNYLIEYSTEIKKEELFGIHYFKSEIPFFRNSLVLILFYEVCIAVMLFGMLTFRKYSFLASLLFTLLLGLLIVWIKISFLRYGVPDGWAGAQFEWNKIGSGGLRDQVDIRSSVLYRMRNVIPLLCLTLAYCANYFKIREIEVR